MRLRQLRTTLKDDTPVLIRPLRPDDGPLIEAGFAQLSEKSRYFRFLRPMQAISKQEIEHLTSNQGAERLALGAVDLSVEPAQPVGIARYEKLGHTPQLAEVAVTVVDSHQGRGLGSLMVGALMAHAVEDGIEAFTALVHVRNSQMLQVFDELGASVERAEDNEEELRIPLHRDPTHYPATLTGDAARRAYAGLAAG